MLRKLIILFLLCFCAFLTLTFLLNRYYSGLSLDMKILQILFLAALVCTNFIYLCLVLYKIDPLLILILVSIYYFVEFIYTRFYKDMDERLKFVYLLAVLIVTTIVVHFIRKKSSPR